MSTRSLLKRLDRLMRAKSASKLETAQAPDFTVDPVLAKGYRDDYERQLLLLRKGWMPREYGGPATAAEEEEIIMLRARISEREKALVCPPGYGEMDFRADRTRLRYFDRKRMSPLGCGGGPLTDAEDAEEAQVKARVTAYPNGPDARARIRISVLRGKKEHERNTAEQTELDGLVLLHPDVPRDPEVARWDGFLAALVEAAKESKERHRRWVEERKERKGSLTQKSEPSPHRQLNKTEDRDQIEKIILECGALGDGV